MQSRREFGSHPFRSNSVKVDLRKHVPRLWGWTVYCALSDRVLDRSVGEFQYSEDAWKAGQIALAHVEAQSPSNVEDAWENV